MTVGELIHKATPYRFYDEGNDPFWGAQVERTLEEA